MRRASLIAVTTLLVCLLAGRDGASAYPQIAARTSPHFRAASGPYTISFSRKQGDIRIFRGHAGLALRELPGGKRLNLLSAVQTIRHSGDAWTLSGHNRWTEFAVVVGVPAKTPGLVSITVRVKPTRTVPQASDNLPDVRLIRPAPRSFTEYAAAPPIAGNSIYLRDRSMRSTILYFSDYTALGAYFDRTQSGPTQPNFSYPGAGQKGALVGVTGNTFGYIPPPTSLDNLPDGKTTMVVRSFLYLRPGAAPNETAEAATYLRSLDTIYGQLPKPSLQAAPWRTYAAHAVNDLSKPANLLTINGHTYLKSYVSDTRRSPELITQAGVLAGLRAYEARYGLSIPLAQTLDANLATFYDPIYHTVTNGLPHDPNAEGESWYFVDNLISLLQLAQDGDSTARQLLLESAGSLITLAHTNNYEFPVTFKYGVWQGGQSPLEPDVAGGYSWLMLGLYDLTGDTHYLAEAEASIRHVAGRGFNLSYETHMTAFTAAAAERLWHMTGDATYHSSALLALANLFHATRLWDCTYGACRKGHGYHTFMGLNPLPWSDYVAMLEQYEAWLALRDYTKYDRGEAPYVTNLVRAFIKYSPLSLRYSLPPLLPKGAASTAAGEYPFVPHNVLKWYIPLEDLREGEATSGEIGQEIYGAGGVFMFAAYSP